MANRTVKDAQTVHGANPQFLIEKIIRTRIYECKFWKEECFALTGAESCGFTNTLQRNHLSTKRWPWIMLAVFMEATTSPPTFFVLSLKCCKFNRRRTLSSNSLRTKTSSTCVLLGPCTCGWWGRRWTAIKYEHVFIVKYSFCKYLEPLLNDFRKLKMLSREGSKCGVRLAFLWAPSVPVPDLTSQSMF